MVTLVAYLSANTTMRTVLAPIVAFIPYLSAIFTLTTLPLMEAKKAPKFVHAIILLWVEFNNIKRLTVCVTCAGAGGGTPSDEKKVEAEKTPVKRADSPASSARYVGRFDVFQLRSNYAFFTFSLCDTS